MDDKATAAKIVMFAYAAPFTKHDATEMESAIVAALEAARRSVTDAARGGIIDCTGDVPCVRRTMRPLMYTMDGAIVQDGDWVWHGGSKWKVSDGKIPVAQASQSCGAFCGYRDIRADECYSTPEAARAAMEGGKA